MPCSFLDPVVMATISPTMVFGDEGSVPINLTCTASVTPSNIISAVYVFTWLRNGAVIDPSDDTRIMVCLCNNNTVVCYKIDLLQITNDTMSSMYYIDANNASAMLDNGIYACQAYVTIAETDRFMDISDNSSVVLKGKLFY